MNTFVSRGFTLVELIIVVAVIAVLAAIAYPSYTKYAFRARRADGKDHALAIASAEERYFTPFSSYTSNLATLGVTMASPYGYYTATISANTLNPVTCSLAAGSSAPSYTITVTPAQGTPQATDACGALRIDSLGTKCPGRTDALAKSNGPCW